ncbi:hypothetical protein HWV62_39860 [Athelia sp. TMB]|nr:hypothetical protein HWV62_39860 [Athelia sp. TMB]
MVGVNLPSMRDHCSTVIDNILRECEEHPGVVACAYFFFDNRCATTELSIHDGMIRSLIRQLSHQSASLPASLVDIYGGGHQQPCTASLQTTLQKIIGVFERAYIVIDALDECAEWEKLINWLGSLLQSPTRRFRIFLSSRRDQNINERFDSIPLLTQVPLAGESANADIEKYLDAMLDKIARWDAETRIRVKVALMHGADGMFRWVALQIEELSKCYSRRAVEAQLRSLPMGLDGIYERSLSRCTNPRDLKQFLLWLAFSTRPLSENELVDVIAVDFSTRSIPSFDEDLRYFNPADMMSLCSGLVTAGWGTVKLAHMSVKDFLVSERIKDGPASYFSINEALAHSIITKTCLSCILHLGNRPSVNESTVNSFPLVMYAVEHWIYHMRIACEDAHILELMARLFSPESNAFSNWVRLNDPDEPWYFSRRTNFSKAAEEIATPLYYASSFGVHEMVKRLIAEEAHIGAQGGRYGNALTAASYHGHDMAVQILLGHDADVNAQGGIYQNALQAASCRGKYAIARQLLERGAEPNAQGGQHGTALKAALDNGHDEVARLLLNSGASLKPLFEGEDQDLLPSAAYMGHIGVVRLLLEHGADVNSHRGKHGSALQAAFASWERRDEISRILLAHGADVNIVGGKFGTALQAASYTGEIAIVRLLLERDADVNLQGGIYGTALQAASYRGHRPICRLLLENGADVNTRAGRFGSAMGAAKVMQQDAVFRLLVEYGAIDMDDNQSTEDEGESSGMDDLDDTGSPENGASDNTIDESDEDCCDERPANLKRPRTVGTTMQIAKRPRTYVLHFKHRKYIDLLYHNSFADLRTSQSQVEIEISASDSGSRKKTPVPL